MRYVCIHASDGWVELKSDPFLHFASDWTSYRKKAYISLHTLEMTYQFLNMIMKPRKRERDIFNTSSRLLKNVGSEFWMLID